jgi:hypothetical protein
MEKLIRSLFNINIMTVIKVLVKNQVLIYSDLLLILLKFTQIFKKYGMLKVHNQLLLYYKMIRHQQKYIFLKFHHIWKILEFKYKHLLTVLI